MICALLFFATTVNYVDRAVFGVLGDTLLVNGTVGPYHDVTTERVRLRLLNASTARVYRFTFADSRPFALVGTDGGLLPAPYTTRDVQLSPGERAEIVVTVRPGERLTLRSAAPDLGDVGVARFAGGPDTFDVLQLRAAGTLAASPPVPARLADIPRLDPAAAAEQRRFVLSGHHINGRTMAADRVDAVVTKDTVEVWRVRNGHDTPHSFHVHDVQFQVLTVAGRRPPPPPVRLCGRGGRRRDGRGHRDRPVGTGHPRPPPQEEQGLSAPLTGRAPGPA